MLALQARIQSVFIGLPHMGTWSLKKYVLSRKSSQRNVLRTTVQSLSSTNRISKWLKWWHCRICLLQNVHQPKRCYCHYINLSIYRPGSKEPLPEFYAHLYTFLGALAIYRCAVKCLWRFRHPPGATCRQECHEVLDLFDIDVVTHNWWTSRCDCYAIWMYCFFHHHYGTSPPIWSLSTDLSTSFQATGNRVDSSWGLEVKEFRHW